MSFILDALRKSETERQRQATPSLVDAQYQITHKSRNVWLPVLSVVLAANLIIVASLYFNGTFDTEIAGRPVQPDARSSVEEVPRPPIPETIGSPDTRMVEPAKTRTGGTGETGPVDSGAAAKPAIASNSDRVAEQESEAASLPSMQQLVSSGQLSVAPLHMDIHVYAGESAKRFVFINMGKYTEGERLDEGPLVERITLRGAILSYQGSRFTLDRE